VIPARDDDRLLSLLEQHGVTITAKNTTGRSWLMDLAVNILPMLLGMLLYVGRMNQRERSLSSVWAAAVPVATTRGTPESSSPT